MTDKVAGQAEALRQRSHAEIDALAEYLKRRAGRIIISLEFRVSPTALDFPPREEP